MALFKKEKVRRPTGFEFSGAVNRVLLYLMQGNHIEGCEEIESFIQGPFCIAFTKALDMIVRNKDEHVEWDDGSLLVKKF